MLTNCYEILLRDGCLTGNKSFDIGSDPDYDPGPGIFLEGSLSGGLRSQSVLIVTSAAAAAPYDVCPSVRRADDGLRPIEPATGTADIKSVA